SLQNGFYNTTEGKSSSRIYCLVQGRGDISAPASANCTKESINVAFEKSGKRYCMAQCNGDISRSVCGKCLNDQLMTFRTTVGSKREWEIYGSSCSM
ncbi:hypothetical protein CISIN_1g039135mg, partial [Citrus sinensis]